VLKIQRSSNGQVIYMLSGQIEEEDIAELEALIRSEAKGRRMVLDLKNLTLAGQEARFSASTPRINLSGTASLFAS
jgi:hypothetical protein